MVTALATIFLAISGLVMWWPGLRRWKRGFRLRRKNLTTLSIDSHRIVGVLSVAWFLMWGVTAIFYALPDSSEDLWSKVTGGKNAFMDLDMRAMETYVTPGDGPEVSLADAERIALDAMPGTKTANVIVPLPGNPFGLPEAYYQFQLADEHLDPMGFFPYGAGQNGVTVGLHGEPTLSTDDDLSTTLWSGYRVGLHTGWMVNPWWRLIWLFFALSPVFFAVTGITMWLRRRHNRGRRRDQTDAVQETAEPEVAATT